MSSFTTCLACHYTRQPSDNAPDWECPKCQKAYIKTARALQPQVPEGQGTPGVAILAYKKSINYFCGLSLVYGGFVIFIADVFARLSVAHESIGHAFQESLHYKIVQPIGSAMLLLPFVVIGAIAAKSTKSSSSCLLVCGHLAATILYFNGYLDSQHALQKHAWTAAALSEGLLPFLSVPVVGLGLLVGTVVSNYMNKRRV
jgi:hypothetical protein